MSDVHARTAALSPEAQALLVRRLAAERARHAEPAEQGLVTGPVPLIPAQKKLFMMFERFGLDPSFFNATTLRRVKERLVPEVLERAVAALLVHHDALRIRYRRADAGWTQTIFPPDDNVPFQLVDLADVSAERRADAISSRVRELQTSLDVREGPLMRIVLFELGAGEPQRLLLVVHHLIADAHAMSILVEDLWTAYQSLERGEEVRLPLKTTSIKRWAERLEAYADSPAFQSEVDYWFGLPWDEVLPLPVDHPAALSGQPSPRRLPVGLGVEDTEALTAAVAAQDNPVNMLDLMHTALLRALHPWTGSSSLVLVPLTHGRDAILPGLSLARTVGWFTVQPNLLFHFDPGEPLADTLGRLTRQRLDVPTGGIGYELLRYGIQDAGLTARVQRLPRAQITLNYVGPVARSYFAAASRHHDVFEPADEAIGDSSALPGMWHSHVPVIHGGITNGRLALLWNYCQRAYDAETMEPVAERFEANLRDLASVCRSMGVPDE